MGNGNDLLLTLSRTARGTPVGDLFRRYWLPVLPASELPQPNAPPVRVTLLCEPLIAFRDSSGQLGLIDEFCPHRGASLWFGRNEDGGLRCAYHGWKFDTTGRCLEIPSETGNASLRERMRLKSYALVERGGILWAYLGAPEERPPLPAYEFVQVPASQRLASMRFQDSNYLQGLEGGMDPFHLAYLHRGEFAGNTRLASPAVRAFMRPELALRLELASTPGGLALANGRENDVGVFWRVMQWLMPCITLIPPFGDAPVHGHAWVPVDDASCRVWTFEYHPTRSLSDEERRAARDGEGLHVKLQPRSYRPVAHRGNDYLIDRAKQAQGIHYSGVPGIGTQDAAIQESMAPAATRKENLVSIDRFIVQARRRLHDAAIRLMSDKVAPPGITADSQQVRSASAILSRDLEVMDAMSSFLRMQAGRPFRTE